jgi:hypothetical protein
LDALLAFIRKWGASFFNVHPKIFNSFSNLKFVIIILHEPELSTLQTDAPRMP